MNSFFVQSMSNMIRRLVVHRDSVKRRPKGSPSLRRKLMYVAMWFVVGELRNLIMGADRIQVVDYRLTSCSMDIVSFVRAVTVQSPRQQQPAGTTTTRESEDSLSSFIRLRVRGRCATESEEQDSSKFLLFDQ